MISRRRKARSNCYGSICQARAPRAFGIAESLGALAGVEERLGKHSLAISYYSKTIELFEQQSSSLERADSIHVISAYPDYYGQFAGLLLSRKQTGRAFEVIDRSRAQTLVRTLAGSHVDLKAGVSRSAPSQGSQARSSSGGSLGAARRIAC